jgi:hypothetical protein
MNPYAVIGSGIGTPEAVSLGVRLSAWHDAMVAHERTLRSMPSTDGCHDECPHEEASALWVEALETFGSRAHELTFLRSRGNTTRRSSHRPLSTGRIGAAPDRAAAADGGVPL